MLFSYQNARDQPLPERLQRFLQASEAVNVPQGMVLGPEALNAYLDQSGVGREVAALIAAVSDEESRERVDHEIRRRIVTGRIPEDVTGALQEIVEVLGLHRTDMAVHEVPLIAALYSDAAVVGDAVVLNIVGAKELADAVRQLWSRVYTSPYPEGSPLSAIAVFRMPPAEVTCEVLRGEVDSVFAGKGWGRLLAAQESCDRYAVDASLAVVESDIVRQDVMTYRNERTGAIVQTAPPDAAAQKLTEDQARMVARDARRAGEDRAVFGVAGERHWLLAFPIGSCAFGRVERFPDDESARVEPSRPEPAGIEIVDLEEHAIGQGAVDEPEAHEGVQESVAQETVDEPEAQEPEMVEETEERFPSQEEAEELTSAAQSLQQAHQFATSAVLAAIRAVDLTMRDWLFDDGPAEFSELVAYVSSKRALPYKQRLEELAELRRRALYDELEPEQIAFALETMTLFIREF